MLSAYYKNNTAAYWYYLKWAALQLQIPYLELHAILFLETNRTLDPLIGNGKGYFGLCQWGKSAAEDLGYSSPWGLVQANPTYEKQFKIVVQWYALNFKRHGRLYSDMGYYYLFNFLPSKTVHFGQGDYALLSASGNNILDADNNGTITPNDLKKVLRAYYLEGAKLEPYNTATIQAVQAVSNQVTESENKGNKKVIYITAGVTAIALLVGGVLVLKSNEKSFK